MSFSGEYNSEGPTRAMRGTDSGQSEHGLEADFNKIRIEIAYSERKEIECGGWVVSASGHQQIGETDVMLYSAV